MLLNPFRFGVATPTAPVWLTLPVVQPAMAGVAGGFTPGATWAVPPATITIQWLLDGAPIAGATGATYTPAIGDIGAGRLSVQQIATNSAGVTNGDSATVAVAASIPSGTVVALSTFTAADNAPLIGLADTIAGVWAKHPALTGVMTVVGNEAKGTSTSNAFYYLDQASPLSYSYDVSADVNFLQDLGSFIGGGLLAEQDPINNTGYGLYYDGSQPWLVLQRSTNGAAVTLAQVTLSAGVITVGVPFKLRLRVVKAGVNVQLRGYIDDVELVAWLDPTPPAARGFPGMRAKSSVTLDNFEVKIYAPPIPAPAWVGATPVNGWTEIIGSTMTGVGGAMAAPFGAPGVLSNRVESWCSFALKGTVAYEVAQGGHTDYWGNEVLSIDFSQNAPVWSVVKASSGPGVVNADSSRYTDGSPAAVHGYNTVQYDPIGNRIVRVGSSAYPKQGGANGDCAVYDLATNAYLALGTIPNMRAPGASKWATWCDPVTGNLYCFFNYQCDRYNKATNTWTLNVASSGEQYGYEAIGCTDTTRGRAFICGGDAGAHQPVTFTFATNVMANVTVTGAAAAKLTDKQFGLQYCPTTDKFYLKNGSAVGGGMVEITAGAFVATDMATTNGAAIPAALVQAAYNGVFSRLLFVELPGGVGGLVYLPTYASNFWFLRLY